MTDLHKAATMALDIDLVELRLELDELKTDAERLNWLCQDFPSGPEKDQRDEILSRMSVMSLSATRAAIDAAHKETSCTEIHKAVLASLDALSDDAAAHIFPSDLQKCMTSECVVQVVSVRAGNPDERTVPLFSREQVDAALREALAAPVVPDANLPSLIRQRILALPRYSFLSPMGGGVRRYADKSGRWIEYDLAAACCEPEAIDSMLAAAPKPKEQT